MTPRSVAHQAPLSMEFSRQDNWSGLPFPSSLDLPGPRMDPTPPSLQVDSLLSEPPAVLCCVLSLSVMSDSFQPHGLYSPPGSSVHGDSPGKNIGVGCHALLQGIFPTHGSNPGLLHCRQILYCLSLPGNSEEYWSG